jgi:selT/selW/selH-like putative selenoprotein
LAADVTQTPGVTVELRPGSGGAFEVSVDGSKVFSKLALKRFPTTQEIRAHLQA